ncbi:unnamed protein product [Caenorhabditis auriculariae]|uniref:DNA/RNA-binding protein Alba-like domain-containing protein n=1 Tax=Caenorhabditis auriculariae TaxID=2777116 RepID=A0A8S1GWJ3_9PELO|nr:unnamed protein product [Caenorhabditis auriculariae]
MLSPLNHLIYGVAQKQRRSLKEVSTLFLVNKEKPLRNVEGEAYTVDELRSFLRDSMTNEGLKEFIPVVDNIFDRLAVGDEALTYFALVATLSLPRQTFVESIQARSIAQGLMSLFRDKYSPVLYAEPITISGVPQLAWDISSVVEKTLAEVSPLPPPCDLSEIQAINEHGLLTSEYVETLSCEALMQSVRKGKPLKYGYFSFDDYLESLSELFGGKSSDLFQKNENEEFHLLPCRVGDWTMAMTSAVLGQEIHIAGKLQKARRLWQKQENLHSTVAHRLCFEFVLSEIRIFSEFGPVKYYAYDFSMSTAPKDFYVREKSKILYDLAKFHLQLLQSLFQIVEDPSLTLISLQEIARVASLSSLNRFSRKPWIKLDNFLIRRISSIVSTALTCSDADLEGFFIEEPQNQMKREWVSIWQRMSPLRLPTSPNIGPTLASYVSDLVIAFRLAATDNLILQMGYTAPSEQLSLLELLPYSEERLEPYLEDVEYEKDRRYLEECIQVQLDKLPSVQIIHTIWKSFFEELRKMFFFVYHFFTKAHHHFSQEEWSKNKKSEMKLKGWLIGECAFDRKLVNAISLRDDPMFGGFRVMLTLTKTMSMFMRRRFVSCYSFVNSLMCLFRRSLHSIIEAKKSELLLIESQPRFYLHHMYSVVFAIRAKMMGLVSSAWHIFEKKLASIEGVGSPQSLKEAYVHHREFVRSVDSAVMFTTCRGATAPIIKMMVDSTVDCANACVNDDAISAQAHYDKFLANFHLFIEQCRMDRDTYKLYSRLDFETSFETPGVSRVDLKSAQGFMEHYVPAAEEFLEASNPFPAPYNEGKTMLVNRNTKFGNILQVVREYFKDDLNRFVVFKSVDGATDKAISCVEVFKNQTKDPLYQWTKLTTAKKIVNWKCLTDGPRDIRATIEFPTLFIVVSRDPFPGDFSCMSMQCSMDKEVPFREEISGGRPPRKSQGTRSRGSKTPNKWGRPTMEQRKEQGAKKTELLREVDRQTAQGN